MELLKNTKIIDYFRRPSAAHAVLIEGASGSGKLTVARHAAAALVCVSEYPPCLNCSFCGRIMAGEFPDVSELIERDPSRNIPVDSIRELIYDANIVPGESERRIFIIGDFERIPVYAQNALLKILEEPPKNVYFILLAQSKASVLSTILSRTVHFKTELLDKDTIIDHLLPLYPEKEDDIKRAAALSDGALGRAMEYLEDSSMLEPYRIAKDYITAVSSGKSLTALSAILPPLKTKRESLPSLARALCDTIRDVMAIKSGLQARYTQLSDSVKFIDDTRLARALEIINEISRDYRNTNIASALTRLNMTFTAK